MTVQDIQNQLRETGTYKTPPDVERTLGDRLFGRFDWWYYHHIIGVVRSGSRAALRKAHTEAFYSANSFRAMRATERCGGKVEIQGAKNLAAAGPCVIMANHMSLLETFVLPFMIMSFGHICTILKESLYKYPGFGNILRAQRAIAVTRTNAREDFKKVLVEAPKAIEEGHYVLVFPQSTRSAEIKPAEMNSLGAKIARRARVPLLPLALKTDFQGVGRWIRDAGSINRSRTIHFEFGPPLAVEGDGREAHRQAVQFIKERFASWGGVVKEDTP